MNNAKILVVDDSATMRRIISAQLNQLGFGNIDEAENGQEGIEVLKREEFDLVLTDWNMPFMDGHTMVRNIRATDKLKHLPILMVTTRNTKADVVEAVKAGVNNFITKPFKPSDLRQKIEAVMKTAKKAV